MFYSTITYICSGCGSKNDCKYVSENEVKLSETTSQSEMFLVCNSCGHKKSWGISSWTHAAAIYTAPQPLPNIEYF